MGGSVGRRASGVGGHSDTGTRCGLNEKRGRRGGGTPEARSPATGHVRHPCHPRRPCWHHLRRNEAPLRQLLQLVPAPLQVAHKVTVKPRLLRQGKRTKI